MCARSAMSYSTYRLVIRLLFNYLKNDLLAYTFAGKAGRVLDAAMFSPVKFDRWNYVGGVEISKVPAFFFSSKKGVFFFERGVIRQIWNKRSFGLAKIFGRDCLLAATTLVDSTYVRFDNIISINLADYSISLFSTPLRHQVHQIDAIDENIYVTETYHNSIAVLDKNGNLLRRFCPSGRGLHKPRSGNYKHFNSVFSDGKQIFLLAHNKGISVHEGKEITGRRSEVITLDSTEQLIDCQAIEAVNGHNIYVDECGRRFFCDSGGRNCLCMDDKVLFKMPGVYVRGLAIGRDLALVGGSKIGDRDIRENADANIFILDTQRFKKQGEFTIKGVGQVYDIRLSGGDFAMSSSRGGAHHGK